MAHIIKYKTKNNGICLTPCPHIFANGANRHTKVGSISCTMCDYNMAGEIVYDNVLVCSYPNKVRE